MSCWRYEFIIDSNRLLRKVTLPKRMAREVKQLWTRHRFQPGVLYFQRGTENRKFSVSVKERMRSTGELETALCEGWSRFASSNNLQLGDRLQFVLQVVDVILYQVRIWRDDEEITVAGANSIDYALNPVEMLHQQDSFFHCTFTKGYVDKPAINIPLDFTREYFHGVKDQTPVILYLEGKTWDVKMRIVYKRCRNSSKNNSGASSSTRNRYNNKLITKCEIKHGIRKVVDAVKIEEGEKVVVELADINPIYMVMFFS